jgi:hypothetical protein
MRNSKKRNSRKRMWLKGWIVVGRRSGEEDLRGEGREI